MRIQRPELTSSRILIIDDEENNVFLFEQILHRAGYNDTQSTTDSRKAMELYRQFHPDLVILDLHMPAPDGFELLEQIGLETAGREFMPVLVVTADVSPPTCLKAVGLGAKDFLTKPIDRLVFLLRTRNLLETRTLYRRIEDKPRHADAMGTGSAERCEWYELVSALACATHLRVDPHGERLRRINDLSARLARALGIVESEANEIGVASMLRDIGQLGLPDQIILPNERELNVHERELYRSHATLGANLLSDLHSPLLALAGRIAGTHHERWDGEGYPLGLKEQAIPIEARIVAVAEFVDSIREPSTTSDDGTTDVCGELTRQSGFRFDPDVVDAMLSLEAAQEGIVNLR